MKKLKQLLSAVWDQIALRKRLKYWFLPSLIFGLPTGISRLFASKKEIDEFFENHDRIIAGDFGDEPPISKKNKTKKSRQPKLNKSSRSKFSKRRQSEQDKKSQN